MTERFMPNSNRKPEHPGVGDPAGYYGTAPFCPACGGLLEPLDPFCPECGQPLIWPGDEEEDDS